MCFALGCEWLRGITTERKRTSALRRPASLPTQSASLCSWNSHSGGSGSQARRTQSLIEASFEVTSYWITRT
jgi:hypothetical protein